jgi:hypothetical protein
MGKEECWVKFVPLPGGNGVLYINLGQVVRVERYNVDTQEELLRVFFSDDQYREFVGAQARAVLDALEEHV